MENNVNNIINDTVAWSPQHIEINISHWDLLSVAQKADVLTQMTANNFQYNRDE